MKNKFVLLQGNEACVEGALYAGMKFYSGYPITPSTEIAEISALKLPRVGGKFIQMEDEIGGIAAAIGGSIAGLKSMTATSGPGISLKLENIGYAAITEIPLVIVNVQRGGPSTGLPTSPSQADVMQSKWGSHGDYPMIVISPSTVQETFELTVKAFNFAEKYRTPVMLLTDEVIGHMREKVEIPEPGELEVYDRKKPEKGDKNYQPYKLEEGDIVPKLAPFGDGFRYHITGLMHDETGFPSNSTENALIVSNRLKSKIYDNLDDISLYEYYKTDDADILIISFGSSARAAVSAIDDLREKGIKAGLFRVITLWPSPENQILELSKKINKVFVLEMNMGQYVLEVERIVKNNAEVIHIGRGNGEVYTPAEIVSEILRG